MKTTTSTEDYRSGWTDGYDANEEEWATRSMRIARKLLDRVDAETATSGYLDMDAIECVVSAFWEYAEQSEIIDILDGYIYWCETNGTASEMKKLMELKQKGRITNA
jgi:hypothetical protein